MVYARAMLRTMCLGLLVACASVPPTKITTPQEYQNVVVELVAQVIDAFKTDGTNCDMLSHDLHSIKESGKFKAAHEWGTSHPEGPQLAQEKINAKKADFDSASAAALHACDGSLAGLLQQLAK